MSKKERRFFEWLAFTHFFEQNILNLDLASAIIVHKVKLAYNDIKERTAQMNYKYIVVQNTYKNRENTRIGFGIAAVEEYDGFTVVFESIEDISSDIESVEELAERCNLFELDIVHFRDFVSDFLESL